MEEPSPDQLPKEWVMWEKASSETLSTTESLDQYISGDKCPKTLQRLLNIKEGLDLVCVALRGSTESPLGSLVCVLANVLAIC